ncbi:MAG: hypothetical protein Q4F80_07810, partial [bacterium]|nr:hypothetical protein [bacterium]
LRNLLSVDTDEDGTPDMISDLQSTGMSTNEIMEFISTNWNVGISPTSDGKSWRIPKGHSSDAWVKEPAYDALAELVNGKQVKNAGDVNQKQMLELKDAVEKDDILTTMYKEGFTFKEAMNVLVKAFPDAGIEYDIANQSTRNYSKVKDTTASGSLYETIGNQILNYWNVGGDEISISPDSPDEDSPSKPSERFDPITFQQGDTTYTFIEDRDGDAKFDYNSASDNELLGSKNGIEELLAYDTNNDGKIDANDLMKDEDGNVRKITNVDGTTRDMTALDALTLMSNRQDESIANSTDVDGYKYGANYKDKGQYTNAVDFNITYTSAADLGITEIDLSGLQQGTGQGEAIGESTRTYDGYQEEYEDINGSSVINQFNIKTDGSKLDKNITAKETLNTESNLHTFYEQVAQSEETNSHLIYSRLDMSDVNEAFADGNWAVEGFASIDAQLETIKDGLEDLLEQANKEEDSDLHIDVTIRELEQQCEDEKDILPDIGDIEIEGKDDEEEKDDDKVDNNPAAPAEPEPEPDPVIPPVVDEIDDLQKELEDNPNANIPIE